jgi:hypothetical protein
MEHGVALRLEQVEAQYGAEGSQAGRDPTTGACLYGSMAHVQHPAQTRLVAEVSVSGQRFLSATQQPQTHGNRLQFECVVKLGVRCIELQGLAPARYPWLRLGSW